MGALTKGREIPTEPDGPAGFEEAALMGDGHTLMPLESAARRSEQPVAGIQYENGEISATNTNNRVPPMA